MSTALSTYRRDLILALRMREVPGDRIGEIVAEVESHVADTGEDPLDAFGPARDYAAGFAGGRRSRWGWHELLVAVASGVGGYLVAVGLLGLVGGTPAGPLPSWAALLLGVAIGVPTIGHVRRRSSVIRDPRTGQEMLPVPRWVPWAVAGTLAAPLVVGVAVVALSS
ncbi:hypothetical protein OF117_12305 [Geodermatophilus sp. YIM 151500]|uniref:HAAS signaling domain-containing protein n=1 Tax=Geodermatophilus sp. YIM 151500 TaxID=2984531 RepID=UPI0021E415C4|nr:hypothetical protein [Geodermatophilus sp. YIM 151500]MCV2490146.1 hypothetical protein [Geodermatophilus sp. YIM 151500]